MTGGFIVVPGCRSLIEYWMRVSELLEVVKHVQGARPFALVLLLLLGCDRTKKGSPPKEVVPQRGDHVVVESSAAEFYEAQVLSSTGPRLKVQSRSSGNMANVQAGNVYRLPSKSQPLANRAFAICNIGEAHWVGCRVTQAESTQAQFEDSQGGTHRLTWDRVLIPGALTELNLRRAFERSAEKGEFEREMARAGNPPRIAGWSPLPGKTVLVRTGALWYLATVLGEHRGSLRLKLFGSRHEIETSREMIAPEPPYPLELLKQSRFALLRPSNQTEAWRPVRLVSADSLDCTLEDFETGRRTAPVRDVCPLQSP